MTNHMPLVSWFEEIGINDRPAVGGKGGSLGELVRAGIRVPPGYVVTTGAFRRFMEGVDPAGGIRKAVSALDPEDVPALEARLGRIRERICGAAMPDELRSPIESSYAELDGGGSVPVAVRSSATSEDSADASFAGLQDTYLWVSGAEEVIDYVRACWASLYSVESVSYRLRRAMPEEELAIAVVVQRMVDARASGVMFTRSPTSGDPSVIAIEASWGLGSCVVSGEVTPDTLLVNKVTGEIIKQQVSKKQVRHVPDPEAGGVRVEDVPDELQEASVLEEHHIGELVDTAKRVERHYGCAQDIEWAIEHQPGEGSGVYLLQSRPETVWSGAGAEPAVAPRARATDHVFALFGGGR
ncbi:MAG TPA: PEP/pyruvate-binding domain-containing protein [Gammaproteobacteria bacterium]|nr:PEP/pyruvate-binding domain-containing protein [Gammaproteobacteria bacterium]